MLQQEIHRPTVDESLGWATLDSPAELETHTGSREIDLKNVASLTAIPHPTSVEH
ncbi:hypothetical protein OOK29_32250 [Streptomyces phaeochromogenes]|uniref:hypothetical protein n=1 Tax=Streptomyces phaeochromogenes TaxID=1923 RepID=UPI00225C010B|nr:hypothetical protein [Streptomyces phaeochromogenes]MCX5602824.1 hypothetical protein [Streptomyces phaeochromogenes]